MTCIFKTRFFQIVFGLSTALSAPAVMASCLDKAPQLGRHLSPFAVLIVNAQEPLRLHRFCHMLKSQSPAKVMKSWESSPAEILQFAKFLNYQAVDFQKEYAKKLTEIQLMPDPVKKIEKAYSLAMSMYGYSQFVGKEAKLDILREMSLRNARGTDAQRAAFVAYTVLKILPKDSLKVKVIVAHPTKSLIPETWVRLTAGVNRIDLDLQNSGLDFIPLLPRFEKSPVSLQELIKECVQVTACILKEVKS